MNTDIAKPELGRLRVGTIQGFKGLEADVVVLVGIDARSGQDAACKTAWGLIGQAAFPCSAVREFYASSRPDGARFFEPQYVESGLFHFRFMVK